MEINDVKYNKSKKSIIIIEGPQGVGKTGMANYCRENIPFSNLLRLNGNSDATISGYEKVKHMYYALLNYLKELENDDINFIFDRIFLSEEAYCRLGYKQYNFNKTYLELIKKLNALDLNIFIAFLYLENTDIFKERLLRDKTDAFFKFDITKSIDQQKIYLELAKELEIYSNINPIMIATDNFDDAYKKLYELLPPLSTKKK